MYRAISRARSPVVSRTVPQTWPIRAIERRVFQVAKLAHQVGRQIAAGQLAGFDRRQQRLGRSLAGSQRVQGIAPFGRAEGTVRRDQHIRRRRIVVGRQGPDRETAQARVAHSECKVAASDGSFAWSKRRQGLAPRGKGGLAVRENEPQRLPRGRVAKRHAQRHRPRADLAVRVRGQLLEDIRPGGGHGDLPPAAQRFLDPGQERRTLGGPSRPAQLVDQERHRLGRPDRSDPARHEFLNERDL